MSEKDANQSNSLNNQWKKRLKELGQGAFEFEEMIRLGFIDLDDIKGVDNKIAKILEESGISLVSDLLDSDMESLLNLKGVDDEALDSIYESVQDYVERKVQPQNEEEEIDLSSLGIDLKLENSVSEEE